MSIENKFLDPSHSYSQSNINDRYIGTPDIFFGYDLTGREREIALLILDDMRSQEIADKLKISYNTVRRHITSMNKKVGVTGRNAFQKKFSKHTIS